MIKAVRAITGLGLKEAKDACRRRTGSHQGRRDKDEAEDIKKQLEEAGATVEVK